MMIFLFWYEPRGGPEYVPTVGGTFKLVVQFRLISAHTESVRKRQNTDQNSDFIWERDLNP